jgi:hypothetical protein
LDSTYLVKITAILMIMVGAANCAGDRKPDKVRPPADYQAQADAPQIVIGPPRLSLELCGTEPFLYDVGITDPGSGNVITRTQARIGSSPLPYYSDGNYIVLPVDANEGETDALGNMAYKAFLVYDIKAGSFRRYGAVYPSPFYFCVIHNTLYVGNHLEESPDGSLTIIDLPSGKTAYVYQLKDGDEVSSIETWAPVIGVNEEGEVVVRLSEYDEKLYRIENGYLVFHQNGIITPPPNPLLPLQ